MKEMNYQLISVERVFLNDVKNNNSLLKKLVDYTYDYFYKFEKKKLNKEKLTRILLRKFKDKKNIYFVIKRNESVIGFVHIWINKNFSDLCLIYIEKEFRGKGIGKVVINYLKKYFKNQLNNKNIKYFRIEVDSKNYSSQKFFEKVGAKEKSKIYFLKI